MNIFLRLKHWQLFLLLFAIPFGLEIAIMMNVFLTHNPMALMALFPVMMIILIGVFFGWMYAVGTGLNAKLPDTVKMSLVKFKVFMGIPVIYMFLIFVYMFAVFHGAMNNVHPNPKVVLLIVPIHLFSMFCIFYCNYFVSKSLVAVEQQRAGDYAAEFFLIWFFPIGVWILQPRINRLFDNSPVSTSL